jgi:hypothetical protein
MLSSTIACIHLIESHQLYSIQFHVTSMYSIQREMNVFNSTSNQYIQFNVKSVNSTEELNTIQLMTFDEVNTRVDQSLYSPKLKVINCFIKDL